MLMKESPPSRIGSLKFVSKFSGNALDEDKLAYSKHHMPCMKDLAHWKAFRSLTHDEP